MTWYWNGLLETIPLFLSPIISTLNVIPGTCFRPRSPPEVLGSLCRRSQSLPLPTSGGGVDFPMSGWGWWIGAYPQYWRFSEWEYDDSLDGMGYPIFRQTYNLYSAFWTQISLSYDMSHWLSWYFLVKMYGWYFWRLPTCSGLMWPACFGFDFFTLRIPIADVKTTMSPCKRTCWQKRFAAFTVEPGTFCCIAARCMMLCRRIALSMLREDDHRWGQVVGKMGSSIPNFTIKWWYKKSQWVVYGTVLPTWIFLGPTSLDNFQVEAELQLKDNVVELNGSLFWVTKCEDIEGWHLAWLGVGVKSGVPPKFDGLQVVIMLHFYWAIPWNIEGLVAEAKKWPQVAKSKDMAQGFVKNLGGVRIVYGLYGVRCILSSL